MLISESPQTVWDVMELYRNFCKPNDFAMLKTTLERIAVTAWGGPIPSKGKRVSVAAREFLRKTPVTYLQDIVSAVGRGCKTLGLNHKDKKKYCSYANKLLIFCKENKIVFDIKTPSQLSLKNLNKEKIYRLQQPDGEARVYQISTTGIRRMDEFGLGTQAEDFTIIREVWTDSKNKTFIYCLTLKCAFFKGISNLFIYEHMFANHILQQELNAFTEYSLYLTDPMHTIDLVLRMLGYAYHIEKIELRDLRLTNLIPFIKLIYSEDDFNSDPDFELVEGKRPKHPEQIQHRLSSIEGLAKRKIQQKAQEVIRWIDSYFMWLDQRHRDAGSKKGASTMTKRAYLTALIQLTKYLYKNETKSPKTYNDIEIVKQLKNKRNNLKVNKYEQKAHIATRCLTWEQAADVVELHRQQTDARYGVPHIKPYGLYPNKRCSGGIASDLQALLILLLMMLIPCDRQQTYRRLEYRDSLRIKETVKGVFLLWGEMTDEEFIPRAKMKRPEQARWWLAIYEFKTAKHYGPFQYPLPNQIFKDGKTLYEYLEMWFFGLEDTEGKWAEYHNPPNQKWQGYIDDNGIKHGWRMALSPQHQFAFSMPRSRRPHDKDSLCSLVKSIFIQFTPEVTGGEVIAVTPNSFRNMIATYTDGKLTLEEEASMAYCEHHSIEKRKNTYTLTENMKKIALAIRVMDKINHDLFLSCDDFIEEDEEINLDLPILYILDSIPDVPRSILDAINQYQESCDKNRFAMLRTAIERYAVAGWGGPVSKHGQHINKLDVQRFLKSLPIKKLLNITAAAKNGCDLLNSNPRNQAKQLSYIKKFLQFCREQGWLIDSLYETKRVNNAEFIQYLRRLARKAPRAKQVAPTGIGGTPRHGLGTDLADYVCCIQTKHLVLGNLELQEELRSFEVYLQDLAAATIVLCITRQILGYLHRVKKVPLADLRLTTIIPLIKLVYGESDFKEDSTFELSLNGIPKYPVEAERKLFLMESLAQRRIDQIARNVSGFIDEYFSWLDRCRISVGAVGGLANSTKRFGSIAVSGR